MNSQFIKALAGTGNIILLLGFSIILYITQSRWSFLWIIGVINYLITALILFYVVYNFIIEKEKKLDAQFHQKGGKKNE